MTNPHYSGTHTRRVITILKVIRAGGWMTRDEIVERLCMAKNGDQHKLLAVLHDEGLLDCRQRARAYGQTGPCPREYRISSAWRDDTGSPSRVIVSEERGAVRAVGCHE